VELVVAEENGRMEGVRFVLPASGELNGERMDGVYRFQLATHPEADKIGGGGGRIAGDPHLRLAALRQHAAPWCRGAKFCEVLLVSPAAKRRACAWDMCPWPCPPNPTSAPPLTGGVGFGRVSIHAATQLLRFQS
jgi:hypothetical protein